MKAPPKMHDAASRTCFVLVLWNISHTSTKRRIFRTHEQPVLVFTNAPNCIPDHEADGLPS